MSSFNTHHLQTVSLTGYKNLLNLDALYVLGYGWLFGMCELTSFDSISMHMLTSTLLAVWQSSFGGTLWCNFEWDR